MIDILYEYNEAPKEEVISLCKLLRLDKLFGDNIASYFTVSADVIKKRQRVYKDLSENTGLYESIEKVYSRLCDLINAFELSSIGVNKESNESSLNSVLAVSSYISFIEESYEELRYYSFNSDGLREFFDLIKTEKNGERFSTLKKNCAKAVEEVRHAKSVTLGINLDVNLRPIEAGLVSVNTVPYRSGSFFDKLFSVSFNDPKDFECLCPLSEMGKAMRRDELSTVNFRLNKVLDNIIAKDFKKLSRGTKEYISSVCTEFVGFKKGLEFYINGIRFFKASKEYGIPVSIPKISESVYDIKGLYNYRIVSVKGKNNTVSNSFSFDEKGRIYILTGANSGGKTVFLESLVFAQFVFQLGFPVFAENAVIHPFENIFVYFASDSKDEAAFCGRFENQVIWFSERIKLSGEKDLFIMDELFSGTAATEAAEISLHALKRIKEKGGHAIFSGHLHELAESVKRCSCIPEYDSFDNLSVKTRGEERLYEIIRAAPESKESKAISIARKYGIF